MPAAIDWTEQVLYEKTLVIINTVKGLKPNRANLLVSIIARDRKNAGWTCHCGCNAPDLVQCTTITSFRNPGTVYNWVISTLKACRVIIECLHFASEADCPFCHIPDVGPTIAHPTSDVIHSHNDREQCHTSFVKLYAPAVFLFAHPSFREAINLPNPKTDFQPHHVASFLTTQWIENMSNLHLILLVHHFLQPTERYSPIGSQIINAVLAENSSPNLYKGPSLRNLRYLAELERAEVKAVCATVKAKYRGTKITTRTSTYGEIQVEEETVIL